MCDYDDDEHYDPPRPATPRQKAAADRKWRKRRQKLLRDRASGKPDRAMAAAGTLMVDESIEQFSRHADEMLMRPGSGEPYLVSSRPLRIPPMAAFWRS